jgi:DNA-binding GntR family transcriptional regulator
MTKPQIALTLPATRRDAVLELLREEIITAVLKPGEVVKDAELASRFGLSITPVREALTQLAFEGLVEMPPNRAKRVAPLSRRTTLETLALFRVLAMTGYEWGISRLSTDDLAHMRAAYQATIAAFEKGDLREASRVSLIFHDTIIHTGGNRQLRRTLAATVPWVERLVFLCFPQGVAPWSLETQRALLEMLEQGRLIEAREIYSTSFDHLFQAIEDLPANVWSAETP